MTAGASLHKDRVFWRCLTIDFSSCRLTAEMDASMPDPERTAHVSQFCALQIPQLSLFYDVVERQYLLASDYYFQVK